MHHDEGVPAVGFSIQKVLKNGELLATRARRAHREATRGCTVILASANRAQIAGTLEHHIFVEIVGAVDGPVDAKPENTERGRLRSLPDQRPKREQIAVRDQLAGLALLDHINIDRHLIEPAHREELQLEVYFFAVPDGFLVAKANIAILIVAEFVERLRQIDHRLDEVGLRRAAIAASNTLPMKNLAGELERLRQRAGFSLPAAPRRRHPKSSTSMSAHKMPLLPLIRSCFVNEYRPPVDLRGCHVQLPAARPATAKNR